MRALETARDGGLFSDPFAAAFVEAAGGAADATTPPSPQRRALAFQVRVRTRYYDEFLLAATTQHGCRQVVVLAAGLDARAYRLPWPPGTHLFELELPAVLAMKDEVLGRLAATPTCTRTAVPVDLRDDWAGALTLAGFDSTVPTAWLVEGLLVYLDPTDADRLFSTVTSLAAPGSRIACERGSATSRVEAPDTESVTRLWQGGLQDGAATWLHANGWESEIDRLDDVATRYGRPPSRPTEGGFVRGVRRAG